MRSSYFVAVLAAQRLSHDIDDDIEQPRDAKRQHDVEQRGEIFPQRLSQQRVVRAKNPHASSPNDRTRSGRLIFSSAGAGSSSRAWPGRWFPCAPAQDRPERHDQQQRQPRTVNPCKAPFHFQKSKILPPNCQSVSAARHDLDDLQFVARLQLPPRKFRWRDRLAIMLHHDAAWQQFFV